VTGRVLHLAPDEPEPEEPDLSPAEQGVHRVRCYAAAALAAGASEVQVMDAAREGIRLGRALLVRE
jgi:hypothetical protein